MLSEITHFRVFWRQLVRLSILSSRPLCVVVQPRAKSTAHSAEKKAAGLLGPVINIPVVCSAIARRFAAKGLLLVQAVLPVLAIAATTPSVTIPGSPLQIRVGEDNSFQITASDVHDRGLVQPYTVVDGTADMGFIVAWPGALFKPDFAQHIGSHITDFTLTGTPYTPRSLSAVSGSGTAADPFTVTVKSDLGNTGVSATLTVQYVNGTRHFTKALTLANAAGIGTTRAAQIMLGAALASPIGEGKTRPYLDAATTSPGGQGASTSGGTSGCPAPDDVAPHTILLAPQTPPDAYFAGYFNSIWRQIDRAQLENRVDTNCDENGGALQWTRTLAPGDSVTVSTRMSVSETAAPSRYTVGGTVSGLTGTGLVLGESHSAQTLPVSANGSVTFPAPLANAAAYAVTVLAQPTSPAQTCSVAQGSGTISGANVTNIAVSCSSAEQVPTLLTLAATPNPIVAGRPLTLRATVATKPKSAQVPESKALEAKAVATGIVTFSDNGTPVGSAPLGVDGSASLAVSSLAVGTHALTARYTGDAENAPSETLTPLSVVVQDGSAPSAPVGVPVLSAGALALLSVLAGLLGMAWRRRT